MFPIENIIVKLAQTTISTITVYESMKNWTPVDSIVGEEVQEISRNGPDSNKVFKLSLS